MTIASPSPITDQFGDQDVLITLPEPTLTATTPPPDPTAFAELLQSQIQQARDAGDPRFLGAAEGLLRQWRGPMTDRLKVLAATIDQSNHRFDAAETKLKQVVDRGKSEPQRRQAQLMLANIHLVQGQYSQAKQHCQALADQSVALIAASCQAQIRARTGEPEAAYDQLQKAVAANQSASSAERLWAEGTLGDIAAQLGNPNAETHWQSLLAVNADDLYTRARLADWALKRGHLDRALSLTRGYESVDSLAVIRAIALKRSGHADAARLAEVLEERFAEAQWRASLLHQRDYARFQLDVADNPERALSAAMDNWEEQREPADTRLALRAAMAAGDNDRMQRVQRWLAEHNQQDARYPEAHQ